MRADLALLSQALHTQAPRSVFRRLSLLGYLSSYSHAGGYYTLDDIPEFDADGLWQHQGVFFSKHGTLKETVVHLVEAANSGHTHRELRARVRVHVHNALLDLVKSKRIRRGLLDGLFLCVSAEQERAAPSRRTIVRVTLEVDARIGPLHAGIESVVEKQIREQRTDDPALRRAFRPLHRSPVRLLHRGSEPPRNIQPNPRLFDVMSHGPLHQVPIQIVKEALD